MSEDTIAQFQKEGEPAFPSDNTGKETPADSQTEKETEAEPTQSDEGANTQTKDDDVPFHKHPRWTEREEAWNKRFNEQESRHQEDLKKIREEFGGARKENAEQTSVPSWFGGSPESWAEYRKDRDEELRLAEERALKRVTETSERESKLVKEATEYFESELTAIESDKTLNPGGEKVDSNKLLKIAIDNDLVDSKGRWNYRAAFQIYRAQTPTTTRDTKDRKNLASATTSEAKAEPKQKGYMTSEDFKGQKKPW